MGFSKGNLNYFKTAECDKFAVECVSNGIISKKDLLRPNYVGFLGKNHRAFNVGKIRKYDEKKVFFEKKRFNLLKGFLYKRGKDAKYANGNSLSC